MDGKLTAEIHWPEPWICGTPFIPAYSQEHPHLTDQAAIDDWYAGLGIIIREYFAGERTMPGWDRSAR